MILSIIVPVYNVENYVEECIKSIISQHLNDFEIVVVDDGSTDSSGLICDNLANSDSRIKVYHKNNGGLMSAWKYGVNHSDSKYIGFVDSDDWIDSDMYSRMINIAELENADIVTSNLIQEFSDGRPSVRSISVLKEGLYTNDMFDNMVFPLLISGGNYITRGIQPHRVTKIYRRSILERSMRFCVDSVSIGEDLLTLFAAIQFAKRIYVMSDFCPYHYRINNSSMINKFSDYNYNQICVLRSQLLIVNNYFKFDFSKQINTDFIKLILMQIEREILCFNGNYFTLSKLIKERCNTYLLSDIIEKSETELLPKKYRLYLMLMKRNLYLFCIVLRKLLSAI